MATQHIDIDGMFKWMRNERPSQWDDYRTIVYPTPTGLDVLRELQTKGLKNVIKKDEDGWFVSFKRPVKKLMRNKVEILEPPVIFKEDGVTLLHEPVGNGSTGTIRLEVYEHNVPNSGTPPKKSIAARWLSAKITHLVPFERESLTDAEKLAQTGLDQRPEPVF